jgi:hypothetical protein
LQLSSVIVCYQQLLAVIGSYWMQLSPIIVVMAVSDSYSQLSSYRSVV